MEDLSVFVDPGHVDMFVFDLQADGIFTGIQFDDNVKDYRRVQKLRLTDFCLQKFPAACPALFIDFGKNFQIQ